MDLRGIGVWRVTKVPEFKGLDYRRILKIISLGAILKDGC